jgi:hypothetical protein
VNGTTIGAAPAVAGAPTTPGIRISTAVRNALFADLVAYYHSDDSGTTRLDKIRAVRDRARDQYGSLLEGEEDTDLNASEQQDLRTIIDWVIAGGPANDQRTYYPPFAAPGSAPGGMACSAPGGMAYGPGGGAMVVQPATLWVPVAPLPTHHRKFFPKY